MRSVARASASSVSTEVVAAPNAEIQPDHALHLGGVNAYLSAAYRSVTRFETIKTIHVVAHNDN